MKINIPKSETPLESHIIELIKKPQVQFFVRDHHYAIQNGNTIRLFDVEKWVDNIPVTSDCYAIIYDKGNGKAQFFVIETEIGMYKE